MGDSNRHAVPRATASIGAGHRAGVQQGRTAAELRDLHTTDDVAAVDNSDDGDDIGRVVPERTGRPAGIPDEIFDAAAAYYRAGERLDMQQLARSLGVSRATLYRRAGNRDRLLAAVIWWDGRATLVDAVRRTGRLTGISRALEVGRLVLDASDRSASLRRFLEAEPEAALRVLTGAHGGVQDNYVAFFERLFELETSRGHLRVSIDLTSLSYAIVRLAEGFLYADIIADRERNIDRAITLIEGLLRGLESAAR